MFNYERLEYEWGNPWFNKDSFYGGGDLERMDPAEYFKRTR